MKYFCILFIGVVFSLVACEKLRTPPSASPDKTVVAEFLEGHGNTKIESFRKAKDILLKLYKDARRQWTFYCGCSFFGCLAGALSRWRQGEMGKPVGHLFGDYCCGSDSLSEYQQALPRFANYPVLHVWPGDAFDTYILSWFFVLAKFDRTLLFVELLHCRCGRTVSAYLWVFVCNRSGRVNYFI